MAIGLIFSGQGAQALGMGKALYDNSAAAKHCFDQANDVLEFDLKTICFEGPDSQLTETRVCQPALYVHGCAAVAALKEAGKLPQIKAACGLSLGELTALSIASVYDFTTGLKIVAERGRLMQLACDNTSGGMASLIGGSLEAAEMLAQDCDVDLGNINCPGQVVLSGELDNIKTAVGLAKEKGFKMAVPLKVAGAYHSRLMQPAADAFAQFLNPFEFFKPEITVLTNTTGQAISEPAAIKAALVSQITSTVLWDDCMKGAMALGINQFYECGPGNVLAGLARRIDRSAKVASLSDYKDIPL